MLDGPFFLPNVALRSGMIAVFSEPTGLAGYKVGAKTVATGNTAEKLANGSRKKALYS